MCSLFFFPLFQKNICGLDTHTRRAGPDVAPLGGGQALPRAPRGARRGEGRATHRRALRVDTPRPPRQRAGRQETRLGDRGRDGLDAPRPFIRARRGRAATRGPRAAGAPAGGVQGSRGRPRSAEPVQRVRRERADQDRYRGFTARERRARAVGTRGGGGIREVPRALAAAEGDARRGGADPPPRGSRATDASSRRRDPRAGIIPPRDDAAADRGVTVSTTRVIPLQSSPTRAGREPRGLLLQATSPEGEGQTRGQGRGHREQELGRRSRAGRPTARGGGPGLVVGRGERRERGGGDRRDGSNSGNGRFVHLPGW